MLAGASSIALGFFFVAFVFVGLTIYFALGWQISARRNVVSVDSTVELPKTFGIPEAFLATGLVLFLLMNVTSSLRRSPVQLTTADLIANFIFTLFIIFFISAILRSHSDCTF